MENGVQFQHHFSSREQALKPDYFYDSKRIASLAATRWNNGNIGTLVRIVQHALNVYRINELFESEKAMEFEGRKGTSKFNPEAIFMIALIYTSVLSPINFIHNQSHLKSGQM